MDRPWEPERTLDTGEASELLREAFPDFRATGFERLGDGWDNSAFLVRTGDESWVFRFPRRTVAAPLLETEAAVLPRIAPRLPVPIPVPERVGRSRGSYPWPFAGYRLLAGETACRRQLDDPGRTRLAPTLGRFLRALHDVPVEPLRTLGLPGDELARLDPRTRLPQLEARLATARARRLVPDPAPILRAAAALDPGRRPRSDVLVHGDLYARHLLVGDDGALSGVIDWGDVHAGDPAQDLGLALGFLPRVARAAFTAEYGAVDDPTWAYARLRALFLAVAILVYGDDVGDEALVREGQAGLRLALE